MTIDLFFKRGPQSLDRIGNERLPRNYTNDPNYVTLSASRASLVMKTNIDW